MKTATETPSGAVRTLRPQGPIQWLGQVLLYGLFALAIGVFSQWPIYQPLAADQAVIKVSVVRLGQPVGECRHLTDEELAELPPNMRNPIQCPRERAPLTMQVHLNDELVLERVAHPGGLSKDGAAAIYERFTVGAGEHHIRVHFSDDIRPGARAYEHESSITLDPGQVLVIDFNADKEGIILQ